MLDEVLSLRSTLSDIEESSFFYISGYFAFKEGLALKDIVDDSNHCEKSVCIRSFSGLYFPAFGLKSSSCWFQRNS